VDIDQSIAVVAEDAVAASAAVASGVFGMAIHAPVRPADQSTAIVIMVRAT
jgi:hypothetical protein